MNRPLLLKPSGKDYLWGGQRLNDEFEKGIDLSPLAETWECSTHPDGPSFVVHGEFEGMQLAEVMKLQQRFWKKLKNWISLLMLRVSILKKR